MNNVIVTNVVRFVVLILLQVLVLQRINLGGEYANLFHIIIYPLFIILLPFRIPHALLVLLGFMAGISVDLFYDSLGIHASAAVFIAFIRPTVLSLLAPAKGYNMNFSPTKARFGVAWFLPYAATMMVLYLFFYFSVEVFTYYYIGQIMLRTICSFFLSMLFITVVQFLFDPLD
ncbi:MAG: hypothetical protein ACI8YQ_002898 [Polaribacter sp.]|jgi:hypothetical protein